MAADYKRLTEDLRGFLPALGEQDVTDQTLIRTVWRALVQVITDVADLNSDDTRLPRTSSAISIPADLTSGITLPAAIVKISFVELVRTTGVRDLVNLVSAASRFDEVEPTPAAYVAGTKLQPISGTGAGVWTHAAIQGGGWNDIASASIEFVPEPTEPTALTSATGVSAVFERTAILLGASDLALGYSPKSAPMLRAAYDDALDILLGTLGQPSRSQMNVVKAG